MTASGDFAVLSEVFTAPPEVDNGNTVLSIAARFSFTGMLSGTFDADFTIVIPPDGLGTFDAGGRYQGSFAGREGSFKFRFSGDIDANTGAAQGDLRVRSGSGDLEDLEGTITLTGITGVGGTYLGQMELDD